ncbi:MAG: hypothetical protein P1Q69_05040 [Candidatus Thorarchaeota archaeon]|nr:hypothetical protein [Candidatus Thorarchaeota archaeon]
MSEDSIEGTDHYESRSYSTPSTQIEDKLKSQQKKGFMVGFSLMMVSVLVFMISFIFPMGLKDFLFLPLLIGGFVTLFGGIAILFLYVVESSGKLKGYEILKVLGPPDPVVGRRYVLVELNDVYIVATVYSGMLHFVAFKEGAGITSTTKMKLPKFFGMWRDKIEVAGVELHRREDTFSVPTARGDFVSGEAVMYVGQYVPSRNNLIVPDFTKEEMIAIAKRIGEDAANSHPE